MTSPSGAPWQLPCPGCGLPVAGPQPCPGCGLPAAGQAALVVARIGATIDELSRDRDALLATLRAAVPSAPAPAHGPSLAPPWPASPPPPPVALPPLPVGPTLPPPPPRHRISPQQVLLGLGALLVVAAAIAFVAVAWTRLGLVFQSVVVLAVTAAACAVSAWTARRGLRATEEALAASGAALLAVALAAAHALGLAGLDAVPGRLWTAVSCAVVAATALALGRATRSTITWPLVALLAAQPVPLLLLPDGAAAGAAGVAVALGVGLLDLVVLLYLRPVLAPIAQVLAGAWVGGAAVGGVSVAWARGSLHSWTATLLLAAAGGVTLALFRDPRLAARLPAARSVAGVSAGVAAAALAGSLDGAGTPGRAVAAGLGLALLAAAVPAVGAPVVLAALLAGGTVLASAAALLMLSAGELGLLALAVLAGTVPAALAAVRLAAVRRPAVAAVLLCPAASVLLAHAHGWLTAAVAGLLLALVAAAGFTLAAVRAGAPEEFVAAGAAALAGLTAGLNTASSLAWGQVAIQLAVAGAAAGAYALVAHRRWVGVAAVADLVAACWIATAGTGVETAEAYTLPAALGLLVVALPALRAGARSWAAEGPAAAVALAPSALVVVDQPSTVRLVLVVVGAGALTVAGTLTHRQAPFVVGAGALALVVLGRLAPYAPLLPRWLTLAVVGLLLLVVGATYERRRQQAREAVAWVAQMR
jgi:hypothetical protein